MINRYFVSASLMAALLFLSAFTVPLLAPVRSSSTHLLIAVVVMVVGIALAAAVMIAGDGAPGEL